MLRTNLDYLTQIGTPAIIIVFPWNESGGTRFSVSLQKKTTNGEAVGHPWLIYLTWKHGMFCYYCKLFSLKIYIVAQQSIPLFAGTVGTTLVPPFWSGRCLSKEDVLMSAVIPWFIGFCGVVHWSLGWRGLGVTFSSHTFLTSPISSLWLDATPQISTHHWVGPRESVSNRTPHLLTQALAACYCACFQSTMKLTVCCYDNRTDV